VKKMRESARTTSVSSKSFLAFLACFGVAATWGCGEMDIVAIDRSKVVTTQDAAPNGIYLEAESGKLSGGFTIGNDPSASSGQFIQPPSGTVSNGQQPGPAQALYQIAIATPGTYTIWGRIQSPDTAHNRFWVQVDNDSPNLWYITTGDIWYWNRVHKQQDYYTRLTFEFAAGNHELLISNATDVVKLDRLYLTTGNDVPPGNNTPCRPPDSIEVNGACIPSCGSQMGNECGIPQCMVAGARIVPVSVYDCQVCCNVPRPTP
jgi:hypothetical protein